VTRQKRHSTFADHEWASIFYTHHQKTIIVDAEIPEELVNESNRGQRRLVAFVGGLDVTAGRWDDQQHDLFASLNTTHKNDFYQGCFDTNYLYGPREPWHDVHSMIEGPAVRDIMQNFTERWRRQVKVYDSDLVDMRGADLDFQCPGPVADEIDRWQVNVTKTCIIFSVCLQQYAYHYCIIIIINIIIR
jgi:phosphatidylserine/phosphatidylglycerophosphate/cardiolipin synthase-like enzyme